MKTKNYFYATLAALFLAGATAQAQLIMYEPFNYTVGTNNPDPDGGVNSNNGLPATNVGGNPTGTGVGLYGNWGTNLSIANGLSYTGLLTAGGSANPTVATWGNGSIRAYRYMTTDPFANLRYYGGVLNNRAGFSYDGTTAQTYYISFLAKATTVADNNFRLVLGPTGDNAGGNGTAQNFYVVSTAAGKWTLSPNGSNASSTAVCTANETALLLIKMEFTGGNVNFSLWKNPPLTGELPAANSTVTTTYTAFNGFLSFGYRPASATAMYVDELRLGRTSADVLPASITTDISNTAKSNINMLVANGKISIESADMIQAELYNLSGALVARANAVSNKAEFAATKGMYLVKVTNKAGKTEVVKVVL
jgi:hypothetical protein